MAPYSATVYKIGIQAGSKKRRKSASPYLPIICGHFQIFRPTVLMPTCMQRQNTATRPTSIWRKKLACFRKKLRLHKYTPAISEILCRAQILIIIQPKITQYRESLLSRVSLSTVPGLVRFSNSTKKYGFPGLVWFFPNFVWIFHFFQFHNQSTGIIAKV